MANLCDCDVTIILVNYNTSELTHAAVNSIITQSKGFQYEIIIIDNSCNSAEHDRLLDLNKNCIVFTTDSNLGFGNANNFGALKAKGRYLFFLNTDTCLVGNAILELENFLDKNPDTGIVGSNLLNKFGLPNYSYCTLEKNLKNEKKGNELFRQLFCRCFHKNQCFNTSAKPKEIFGFVSGAALMIRKNFFDCLNGFSPEIFMYGEDALLCFRLRNKLHKKIYNVPSSVIIHLDGGSNKENLDFVSMQKHFLLAADGNYLYYRFAFNDKTALKYLKYYYHYYQKLSLIFAFFFYFKKAKKYRIAEKVYKEKYNIQKDQSQKNSFSSTKDI